jgi:dolichyl-phosphate-mannose-protein mannosyltransferase
MDKNDLILMFILLCISSFIRLYKLNEPNAVIFDELHNMQHISLILQRRFYFDVEPPLAKLLIAFIGRKFLISSFSLI